MSVSVRPGSHARDVRTKVKKGFCDVSFLVAGAHLYRFIFVLQLHVFLFKSLCDVGRSNRDYSKINDLRYHCVHSLCFVVQFSVSFSFPCLVDFNYFCFFCFSNQYSWLYTCILYDLSVMSVSRHCCCVKLTICTFFAVNLNVHTYL